MKIWESPYLGPVDGHNIPAMREIIQRSSKRVKDTVLVHVITQKGKGYVPAETTSGKISWNGSHLILKQELPLVKPGTKPIIPIFFQRLCVNWETRNEKVVAITAAMADGTGLKRFRNMFPDRFL